MLACTVLIDASKSAAILIAATPSAVAATPAAATPVVMSLVLPPAASMVVAAFWLSPLTLAMPAVKFEVSASRRTVMLRFNPPAIAAS